MTPIVIINSLILAILVASIILIIVILPLIIYDELSLRTIKRRYMKELRFKNNKCLAYINALDALIMHHINKRNGESNHGINIFTKRNTK